MENYYIKYVKYKNKYINLQKLIGSGPNPDPIKIDYDQKLLEYKDKSDYKKIILLLAVKYVHYEYKHLQEFITKFENYMDNVYMRQDKKKTTKKTTEKIILESKPYGDILREILVISPNSADLKPFINALIDYGDPLDDEFRKELFTRICRAEYTSLRDAIFNKLLEIDSNLINMRSSFGETPLMLSKYALNPNKSLIGILIEKGADINAIDISGNTALLHYLTYQGLENIEVVKSIELLIKKGANVEVVNNEGMFPLFSAVEKNNVELTNLIIEKLGDKKIEVINKTYEAKTPLKIAIEKGNEYNLSLQFSSLQFSKYFDTLLTKNVSIIDLLYKNGAKINDISVKDIKYIESKNKNLNKNLSDKINASKNK